MQSVHLGRMLNNFEPESPDSTARFLVEHRNFVGAIHDSLDAMSFKYFDAASCVLNNTQFRK